MDYIKYVLGYIRQLMTDWVTLDQNSLDVFYVENAVSHTKNTYVEPQEHMEL